MTVRRRRGGRTAAEFMQELAQDEDYQRRKAERDAEIAAHAARLREAQEPIAADLRAVGYEVSTLWDLGNKLEPYPDALPVLINHFEHGGYPDRVMQALGTFLGIRSALPYWDRIKTRYIAPRTAGEEEGAAMALSGSASSKQVDDMIDFLSMDERGRTRIYFIKPILRFGGARGRSVVEGLQDDPVLGKEATALITGRE